MAGNVNIENIFTRYSKLLLIGFAVSLLLSIYLLSTLPADIKFKGNVQYMDLVQPVLFKLYFGLGISAILAIIIIYAEMKNKRTVIVYKEKNESQIAEEKTIAEANRTLEALTSKAITATDSKSILSDTLNLLAKEFEAVSGACYFTATAEGQHYAELQNGFALPVSESDALRFNYGEGLVGQVAKSGVAIYVDEMPEGYFQAMSGLGQAIPKFLLVLPMKKGGEVKGVLELATFKTIGQKERQTAEKFANEVGERLV